MNAPALVPELYVTNIARSRRFYLDTLGFDLLYERPEEKFCAITLGTARLMLEELNDGPRCWRTGSMEPPLGRGINFEIAVTNVDALLERIDPADLFLPAESRWYKIDQGYGGQRQFIVSDPDGYLLRFAQSLGSREMPPSLDP